MVRTGPDAGGGGGAGLDRRIAAVGVRAEAGEVLLPPVDDQLVARLDDIASGGGADVRAIVPGDAQDQDAQLAQARLGEGPVGEG